MHSNHLLLTFFTTTTAAATTTAMSLLFNVIFLLNGDERAARKRFLRKRFSLRFPAAALCQF